jgi:hypothetical protein
MRSFIKRNLKVIVIVLLALGWFLSWFFGNYKIVSRDAVLKTATETQVTEAPKTVDPFTTANSGKTSGPSYYQETGVGKTETYNFTVKKNELGIVGGYQVDSNSGGVYMVLTPGEYTVKVTDGFVLTVDKSLAQAEWDFRLNQAKTNHWAMALINKGPLK